MKRSYWVYILASRTLVLYVGVTNDVKRRVAEHRVGQGASFTRRYHVRRLVYLQEHGDMRHAIHREKVLKGWARVKKTVLAGDANPESRDLTDET